MSGDHSTELPDVEPDALGNMPPHQAVGPDSVQGVAPASGQVVADTERTGPYRPRLDYGSLAGVKVVGGRDGALDTGGGSGP